MAYVQHRLHPQGARVGGHLHTHCGLYTPRMSVAEHENGVTCQRCLLRPIGEVGLVENRRARHLTHPADRNPDVCGERQTCCGIVMGAEHLSVNRADVTCKRCLARDPTQLPATLPLPIRHGHHLYDGSRSACGLALGDGAYAADADHVTCKRCLACPLRDAPPDKTMSDVMDEDAICAFLTEYGRHTAKEIQILIGEHVSVTAVETACYRLAQRGILLNRHGKYSVRANQLTTDGPLQEQLFAYLKQHPFGESAQGVWLEEIANDLGWDPERVYRTLRRLRRAGSVERVSPRRYRVVAPARRPGPRIMTATGTKVLLEAEPYASFWGPYLLGIFTKVRAAQGPHWRTTVYYPLCAPPEFIAACYVPEGTFERRLSISHHQHSTYDHNFAQAISNFASPLLGERVTGTELPFDVRFLVDDELPPEAPAATVYRDRACLTIAMRRPLITPAPS